MEQMIIRWHNFPVPTSLSVEFATSSCCCVISFSFLESQRDNKYYGVHTATSVKILSNTAVDTAIASSPERVQPANNSTITDDKYANPPFLQKELSSVVPLAGICAGGHRAIGVSTAIPFFNSFLRVKYPICGIMELEFAISRSFLSSQETAWKSPLAKNFDLCNCCLR